MQRRVLILGAAGRDFHDFNMVYRDDVETRVVAFTASQIPGIAGRRYPAELAGLRYPDGIPIENEADLERICRERGVEEVVFAYSDVTHAHVMHLASRALAVGAGFRLLGPQETMLRARVPVIAVTAVRTGCGKSAIARWLGSLLRERGLKTALLRHPMPYGDLRRQRVQRYAVPADLDLAACTLEEREEYEPHLAAGNLVFAGVDYAAILSAAEAEAQIIVWDGGNNDFPFVRPDLHIVVIDALRPDQIDTHHPGETVARMADIAVINKVDSADPASVERARAKFGAVNPGASIVMAKSPVRLENAPSLGGKRVIIVEDGPTITHGGMASGAGLVAAHAAGAEVVDPWPTAAPLLREALRQYPHIGPVLPALGYNEAQRDALRASLEASPAEFVISATPIDLARLLPVSKPILRARYEFAEASEPGLRGLVEEFLTRRERQSAS